MTVFSFHLAKLSIEIQEFLIKPVEQTHHENQDEEQFSELDFLELLRNYEEAFSELYEE